MYLRCYHVLVKHSYVMYTVGVKMNSVTRAKFSATVCSSHVRMDRHCERSRYNRKLLIDVRN